MTQRVKRRDRLRKTFRRGMPARFDQARLNQELASPNLEFLKYLDLKIAECVLMPPELRQGVEGSYPSVNVNEALFRSACGIQYPRTDQTVLVEGPTLHEDGTFNYAMKPSAWTELPSLTLEDYAQLEHLRAESNRMYLETTSRQYGRQRRRELAMRQALERGLSCVEATAKGLNRLSLGPEGQVVRTFIEGSEPKDGVRGLDPAEAVIIYDSSQEKP